MHSGRDAFPPAAPDRGRIFAFAVRRTAPSLLVPAGSVASTTGRTFVIRVRSGRTEWIDVKTGLTSGALVEVFGDLKPGDQIAALHAAA